MEGLVSGDTLPGSQLMSHGAGRGTVKALNPPATLCNRWQAISTDGLHWAIGLGWWCPASRHTLGAASTMNSNCVTGLGSFIELRVWALGLGLLDLMLSSFGGRLFESYAFCPGPSQPFGFLPLLALARPRVCHASLCPFVPACFVPVAWATCVQASPRPCSSPRPCAGSGHSRPGSPPVPSSAALPLLSLASSAALPSPGVLPFPSPPSPGVLPLIPFPSRFRFQ